MSDEKLATLTPANAGAHTPYRGSWPLRQKHPRPYPEGLLSQWWLVPNGAILEAWDAEVLHEARFEGRYFALCTLHKVKQWFRNELVCKKAAREASFCAECRKCLRENTYCRVCLMPFPECPMCVPSAPHRETTEWWKRLIATGWKSSSRTTRKT
jgi:hypothetical protein